MTLVELGEYDSAVEASVEEHIARWRADGTPDLDRFEIAVTPDGQNVSWPTA